MKSISVPFQILEYIQKNKLISAVRWYYILQLNCSGTISRKSKKYKSLATTYYTNRQTLYNHIKVLIEIRFISINRKSNIIHLISQAQILSRFNGYKPGRVVLSESHFSNFNEFCFAGIISIRIDEIKRGKKYGKSIKKLAEQNNRSSINLGFNVIPYFGLTTQTISDLTNLSIGSVVSRKKKCSELKYLKIRSKYHWIKLNLSDGLHFKKYSSTYGNRLKVINGSYAIQLMDEIIPLLRIIRRTKKEVFSKLRMKDKNVT